MAQSRCGDPVLRRRRADVDMSAVVAAPPRRAAGVVEHAPSLNDFVVKAAALALREFPRVQRSYVDGRIERYSPRQRRDRRRDGRRAARARRRRRRPEAARRDRDRDARGSSDGARSRSLCARGAARRRRSRSRTSGCSACARSPRSSTRRRWRSSPSARCGARPSRTTHGGVVFRDVDDAHPDAATIESSTAPTARASCRASAQLLEHPLAGRSPSGVPMPTIDFRTAIRDALDEELAARRARDLLRRGRRGRRRRLRRRRPGLYEKYGARARLRHADLGARARRRGVRRGGLRAPAGRSRSCSATS